jgi:hypothetical protein
MKTIPKAFRFSSLCRAMIPATETGAGDKDINAAPLEFHGGPHSCCTGSEYQSLAPVDRNGDPADFASFPGGINALDVGHVDPRQPVEDVLRDLCESRRIIMGLYVLPGIRIHNAFI